jgi:hypothetical protein
MERILVSGEAYDPISMTTIIKNLTGKYFFTKQLQDEGCTITILTDKKSINCGRNSHSVQRQIMWYT